MLLFVSTITTISTEKKSAFIGKLSFVVVFAIHLNGKKKLKNKKKMRKINIAKKY